MSNLEEPWGQYVHIDEELGIIKNQHKHYPVSITPSDINKRHVKYLPTIYENNHYTVVKKENYSRGYYTLNRYCFGLLNLYFTLYSYYKSFH